MDRLSGIEVFVRAMRLGGLSAAARELGMSAAMAAKHLNALEARLGTTLVHRTTRRLALTQAGADYLDKAERILADVREAEAEASSRAVAVEGPLRVTVGATFGVRHIAPLIARFNQRHPGVTVELGLSDRYVDLVEERWDVAIRIGRLADSRLVARKLADMHMAICAAPAYLARHGTPRTVADLATHECLCFTLSQPGWREWRFGAEAQIRVPVNGSLHADNGEALVEAAVAGLGLVYGPRFIAADALAAGDLVEIALDHPLMQAGAAYAVTLATRRPAVKIRAFVDFLVETVPERGRAW
jgi:DNA-binding transcriptional LysR family regulator